MLVFSYSSVKCLISTAKCLFRDKASTCEWWTVCDHHLVVTQRHNRETNHGNVGETGRTVTHNEAVTVTGDESSPGGNPGLP